MWKGVKELDREEGLRKKGVNCRKEAQKGLEKLEVIGGMPL